MNQQSFEGRVIDMWTTTRIPLTRANLMAYTQAPRKRMEGWLDELTGEGVLDVDSDDDGEMIWTVRGAVRPPSGPETVAELKKLDSLRSEIGATSRTALALASSRLGLGPLGQGRGREEKSVLASGLLSFFFGPFGWLYAAPMKEAIPGILIYMFMFFWFPILHFLLIPLLPVANAVSALAGAMYAARYNERGERTPLANEAKRALPGRRS